MARRSERWSGAYGLGFALLANMVTVATASADNPGNPDTHVTSTDAPGAVVVEPRFVPFRPFLNALFSHVPNVPKEGDFWFDLKKLSVDGIHGVHDATITVLKKWNDADQGKLPEAGLTRWGDKFVDPFRGAFNRLLGTKCDTAVLTREGRKTSIVLNMSSKGHVVWDGLLGSGTVGRFLAAADRKANHTFLRSFFNPRVVFHAGDDEEAATHYLRIRGYTTDMVINRNVAGGTTQLAKFNGLTFGEWRFGLTTDYLFGHREDLRVGRHSGALKGWTLHLGPLKIKLPAYAARAHVDKAKVEAPIYRTDIWPAAMKKMYGAYGLFGWRRPRVQWHDAALGRIVASTNKSTARQRTTGQTPHSRSFAPAHAF